MNPSRAIFLLLIIATLACQSGTLITPTPTITAPPRPTVTPTLRPAPTATSTNVPRLTNTPKLLTIDEMLARCPTAQEIASVNADVKLIFESDPTTGKFVCAAADGSADLTRLQERVYQAILIMKRFRFDAPLPWTNKSLYLWFVGAIKNIRFRRDIEISYCCDPKDTLNIQTRNLAALDTLRWIDPKTQSGLQGLVALFVHEARHNENVWHTCNNGADDKTLNEMGAWAVQYHLLFWLAYHSDSTFLTSPDPSPTFYREAAAREAFEIRRTRFCSEPTPLPMPTLKP